MRFKQYIYFENVSTILNIKSLKTGKNIFHLWRVYNRKNYYESDCSKISESS